ncbi:MAG: hypothetical protein GTN80_05735 [Nitrososphaeria archaeon]|nr:hypothetical protein [Nitrososphaeria archaeon]NIN52650.1 hypothetical protein [Nitrososphaeria archaeon]NIQ33125.1 hypothetical protein [Nitrososphaeria archaeon]
MQRTGGLKEKKRNLQMTNEYFESELAKTEYEGVLGVAKFKSVYEELMPVQKRRLEELCGDLLHSLIEEGSIICIGVAYPEAIIDCINVEPEGKIDRDEWNIYAKEYGEINSLLNTISDGIADMFHGIQIPATVEGYTKKVQSVEDYYGMTVSHRVVAENAGLGWRGKNELLIHERYSCALRFASVIVDTPLNIAQKKDLSCGDCTACLDVCSFLRNKEMLENYRENCRRHIVALDLKDEVCGKCILACYRQSIFSDKFQLRP